MTFQSCLSALLGLAILSLCNIALVNAGDENTVYAVQANVCTYRSTYREHKVELDKTRPKVIRVPVGLPCALRYNTNTTDWDCKSTNNETPLAKGTAIFMVMGLEDPDSGNAIQTCSTQDKKRLDGYIVADTVAKSRVLWSKGYAVISQLSDTQEFLCIKEYSRHPRVFGLTLKLEGNVGWKSKGRFGTRDHKEEAKFELPTLVVANRPSGKFPPVWELTYEGEYAKGKEWELKLMNGKVDAKQVVGRGIAIKVVKDKKTKDAVTFSLVKASSWPPKHELQSTVAYIIPSTTCSVKFQNGKVKFTDQTKTRVPSIEIELEKLIVIEIPEIPKPLEMLTAVTELPADHIERPRQTV